MRKSKTSRNSFRHEAWNRDISNKKQGRWPFDWDVRPLWTWPQQPQWYYPKICGDPCVKLTRVLTALLMCSDSQTWKTDTILPSFLPFVCFGLYHLTILPFPVSASNPLSSVMDPACVFHFYVPPSPPPNQPIAPSLWSPVQHTFR